MPNFEPGEHVYVPSTVRSGAFPGEKLVTVDTKEGPISGFVRREYVVEKNDKSFLVAVVTAVSEDTLTVLLSGSFFTTTGVAFLSPSANLERALEAGG